MIGVAEFKAWVATLEDGNGIAVDDGGLTLVEIDRDGQETGAYYEVGGIPLADDGESVL